MGNGSIWDVRSILAGQLNMRSYSQPTKYCFTAGHRSPYYPSLSLKKGLLFFGLALLSTLIFEHSQIDVTISNWFYIDGSWLIEKDAQPFRFIFYDFPKTLIILLGIYLLINLVVNKQPLAQSTPANNLLAVKILSGKINRWLLPLNKRELSFLLLTVVIVPSIIAALKGVTHVSCPNHLIIYNGDIPYLSLWQDIISNSRAKCFPAAHASAGFALYVFAYLPRLYRHKVKIIIAVSLLGWIMGLYKMLIGDHFFSHTLVSMWLSWAIAYVMALLFFKSS